MYKAITVFDLDHTLVNVNSSFMFGKFLYKSNYSSKIPLIRCLVDYACSKYLGMHIKTLHHKIFEHLFKGLPSSIIETYAIEFLNKSLSNMLSPHVFQRLKQAQINGDYTVILSSSPHFLVKPIAERLKINEWQSSVYSADDKGIFDQINFIMEGTNKAQSLLSIAARLQVPTPCISVYSDSHLDLPVLKIAGKAIAVNPDRRLRKVSKQNNWEILESR